VPRSWRNLLGGLASRGGLTFAFRDVRTVVLFGHGVLVTHTLHAQTRAEEVRLALMETYPSIMIQAVRYYSTYEKNQYVLEFGDDMQVIAAKLALGGMEAGRGGTHWSRGVRGADDHDPGAGSPASLWQGTMHDDSGMETLFWLRWADADDARHAAGDHGHRRAQLSLCRPAADPDDAGVLGSPGDLRNRADDKVGAEGVALAVGGWGD
jgi:hypothetical protein